MLILCNYRSPHIGSSLISHLAEYLKVSRGARGVTFDLIIEGTPGLGLSGPQPLIDSKLRSDRLDFVVIHVGANDIENMSEDNWQKELGCTYSVIHRGHVS